MFCGDSGATPNIIFCIFLFHFRRQMKAKLVITAVVMKEYIFLKGLWKSKLYQDNLCWMLNFLKSEIFLGSIKYLGMYCILLIFAHLSFLYTYNLLIYTSHYFLFWNKNYVIFYCYSCCFLFYASEVY